MRTHWLVVASLFGILDASCAQSTSFDDLWATVAEESEAEESEAAVPVPELSQTEYEVTVDLATGALTKKYVIKDVRWIFYNPFYNETTGEHTFIGMWEDGQPPTYMYTYDRAGVRLLSPEIPLPNNIFAMQYSRATGVLYGIRVHGDKYSLVKVDRTTGTPSLIREIPGVGGLEEFTIDEANQRMFVRGVHGIESELALWTIDLASGNIISRVPMPAFRLVYDNATRTLYGLRGWTVPATYESFFFLCRVDPATGALTKIGDDLPGVSGISMDTAMFNEQDHVYMFVGIDKVPNRYIFSVDATTGKSTKTLMPTARDLGSNNLAFPHYDNKRKKLYAMYWQGSAPPPPVIGIVP